MHNSIPHPHISPARAACRPLKAAGALVAVLACALLLGCAAKRVQQDFQVAPVWEMTDSGRLAYLFLIFDQARAEQDEEAAGNALNELLQVDDAPELYLEGANFHWRQGRLAETRDLLKQGIEKNPDNKQLYLTLATTYLAENRYDDAAVTIRTYLRPHPEDYELRQELAAILLENGQYAEALDTLQEVPEAERSSTVYYYMAKARTGLGLTQKAISDLKKALEMNPRLVEAWAELAYLYEVEKDLISAENIYARILELGQTGREVWLRLINLNIKLNNPDKAMAYYRQGPDDTDFALEAATSFLDDRFYEQAREILQGLQERGDAPNRVNFYLAVLAYEGDKDPEKALEYLRQIPDEDPHYIQSLRFRIQLRMEMNQYEEAMDLARQGQQRFPDASTFWMLEANVLEDRGEIEQAAKVLDDALLKWPESTELLYAKGVLLDKVHDSEGAIEVMEKIISINPEHADALNFLGYTLAELNRDLDRALVLVRRALELKPDSGYIVDSLAWVYYRQGDFEKAWEEIGKAAELVKTDPVVWEHYGDIAKALGLTKEAREGYRRSLEIKPDNEEVKGKLEAI